MESERARDDASSLCGGGSAIALKPAVRNETLESEEGSSISDTTHNTSQQSHTHQLTTAPSTIIITNTAQTTQVTIKDRRQKTSHSGNCSFILTIFVSFFCYYLFAMGSDQSFDP